MKPVPPVTNAFIAKPPAPVAARILVRSGFPHNAGMANSGDVLENPFTFRLGRPDSG
jgi:hypothetical protein